MKKRIQEQKKKRIWIKDYLKKAGYSFSESQITNWIVIISISLSFLISISYIYFQEIFTNYGLFFSIWVFSWLLIACVPIIYLCSVLIFFVTTDLIIDSRKVNVEKVLPEFLHLTAANIRAGMSVDQALWSAVRPKFGILSREIEHVAKKTMVGDNLGSALHDFSNNYDSLVLKRTVSLIVEGIESGSEIGDLLENVALSIEDMQTRKESMAANVTSNVIFIMFSVLFAAPFLFAISIQLLGVVHNIGQFFNFDSGGNFMDISFSISADAVRESDFLIFCYLSITLSCIMANIIISTIKTGRPADSIKKIPITVIVSILVFILAKWALSGVFANMF